MELKIMLSLLSLNWMNILSYCEDKVRIFYNIINLIIVSFKLWFLKNCTGVFFSYVYTYLLINYLKKFSSGTKNK